MTDEIPFRQTPPAWRTVVDGIWSDILDKWLATFESTDGTLTEVRTNLKNIDELSVALLARLVTIYDTQEGILNELRLLNARIEEAFETGVEDSNLGEY